MGVLPACFDLFRILLLLEFMLSCSLIPFLEYSCPGIIRCEFYTYVRV